MEERLLGRRRPRLEQRRLGREQRDEPFPVEQRLGRLRLAEHDQARLLGQHVAHERPFLPGLAVLGPVAHDRRIELEHAPLGEQQRAGRGERLRDGVRVHDRVLLPRHACERIGVSRPEVDREPAVEPDGHRGAELAALLEAGGERGTHGRELRLAEAVHLDSHEQRAG